MKFSKEIEAFIDYFLPEIEARNAAIFAGAGLSAASGMVDWKKLLKEFADDLGLDIQKETDLISLIQFHLNKNSSNRHRVNKKITEEFHHGKVPNENHKILARLPISLYWTTNYDKLIETGLNEAGKIVDVKYTIAHLADTVPGRDAILYKMHGDVGHPSETILSKDEYERYYHSHGPYLNALSGDLVSRTFLFIGFSFTDPNLEYVLSRIRVTFKTNQKTHYCFFKELERNPREKSNDFDYRKTRQALVIQDLDRFNIKVLIVKQYADITLILKEIESRFKQRTVYISGSAVNYGKWDHAKAEKFISDLSKSLIKNNFKIISGFGLGVGRSVITGVLEEVYVKKHENLKDQLLLRPFPKGANKLIQTEYRKDMLAYAGVAIFIFGNKLDKKTVVLSAGMLEEFRIAKENKIILLPIGATGSRSKELWQQVLDHYQDYFPGKDHIKTFTKLGDENLKPKEIIDLVLTILNNLK